MYEHKLEWKKNCDKKIQIEYTQTLSEKISSQASCSTIKIALADRVGYLYSIEDTHKRRTVDASVEE